MTDLSGMKFLFVDDDLVTVKHHMDALRAANAATVKHLPSLSDAYKHFEALGNSNVAPPYYALVLIDLHCPPLPPSLARFIDGQPGRSGINVGQALGRYLEDRFGGQQPYAYLSVVPDGWANMGGAESRRSVINKMSEGDFPAAISGFLPVSVP